MARLAAAARTGGAATRAPDRVAASPPRSTPILLWHRTVAGIASEFHLDARYLIAGWAPWALMALACSAWRSPPSSTGAPATAASTTRARRPGRLGVSLYCSARAGDQVAQIADSLGRS